MNISGSYDEIINMYKTEMETSNKNLVAECMLNKVSIHVFVSSSQKVLESGLKQSFLCCPAISYDILVIQQ